jgi:type IV secretory pathway TraG/TraD family ATPase VirD4
LLELLIKSDIDQGYGCAVLDPHGDLIDDILRVIPKHRVNDVVLFDPSDIDHPPSFNPMIPIRPDQKMRVALGFLDTFKRVVGQSWSDKMDYVLRYAMIALLNVPGTSIVSLRRLLSDDDFRNEVVKRSNDDSVRRFWEVEFPANRSEFEAGPISKLLNRLDELLATDMIRNILGQPTNSFDFRDFMDSRKIVLCKVSKGVLGPENSALLGSLIIWKIYEAALSRADTPEPSRQDFYFYIDEFQNFATSSFGEILSESRKYRLCLTFANQFLGQLPPGVSDTVFGNIANLISFRVGAQDAGPVANELKPNISTDDLLNLGLRSFYSKMSVDGEVQEVFSASTLDVHRPPLSQSFAKECIAQSRKKYALPIAQAEEQLALSEIMSPRSLGAI